MAISAQMVKDLREKTGAGMMDCKKALVEVDGDMEKAIDWLRQKGIAKAAKKSGRATSEGLVRVVFSEDGNSVAMTSLLCETDFVARGESFQNMAQRVAETVLKSAPADIAALDAIIGDEVRALVSSIGENLQLGKFAARKKASENEAIGQYVHHNGKIGVLVFLETGKAANVDNPAVKELANHIAMQIAFSNPLALDPASLDPAIVEREREVYRQKAINDGKPANIIDKIADGAVKKFEKENCLLEQSFFLDEKKSINDIVKDAAKSIGDTIRVIGFERIQLGSE